MHWITALFIAFIGGGVCYYFGKQKGQEETQKQQKENLESKTQERIEQQARDKQYKNDDIKLIKECLTELNLINSEEFCHGIYEAIKHKYISIDSNKNVIKRQIKSILQLNKKKKDHLE